MTFKNIKIGDVIELEDGTQEKVIRIGHSIFLSEDGGWFFSGQPLIGRKRVRKAIKILKKEEHPEAYL